MTDHGYLGNIVQHFPGILCGTEFRATRIFENFIS